VRVGQVGQVPEAEHSGKGPQGQEAPT
jgi:hypothetical protein